MVKSAKNEPISLGNRVRDTITGFEGVATSRTVYLYGCVHIGITPSELREGKPIESQWFDEQRVEIVAETKPKVSANSRATSGGPAPQPHRVVR